MALGQGTLGLRLLGCRRDKIRDCAQGLKTHFWNMSPDQVTSSSLRLCSVVNKMEPKGYSLHRVWRHFYNTGKVSGTDPRAY